MDDARMGTMPVRPLLLMRALRLRTASSTAIRRWIRWRL